MRWLLGLLLLPGCWSVTCAGTVRATRIDGDTVVRCSDGTEIARRRCRDGGYVRETPGRAVVLCDGATLVTVEVPK